VHFAHQQGVLHRDIKPSNMLVDPTGNARVMDFGLAKYVDRSHRLTVTGQILGTPADMAPERITNRPGELGPACDIYGVGALLYELSTGQSPFKGRDQLETLLHVLDREPSSPRQLNPNVPHELELICLKCLEKAAQQRYASAKEVADDLARHLSGDSINLSSPKLMDRFVRTLERSQYDQEVHTWSRLLIQFGWIALATHLLIYLNRTSDWPYPLGGLITIRLLEVIGLGAVLWHLRHQWYPPRGAPARQL
jgi:serine/threonine-protein kinase